MRNLLLLFWGGVLILGCNLVNPAEQVPTYIKIDSVSFGDGSHKITSTWVYYNNAPVGVFKLPATVPVLADKAGTITLGPGISYNGFQDQQALYPFYSYDTFAIDPAPGKVITHTFASKYTTFAKFRWKENFELGSAFQPYDPAVTTNIITATSTPGQVFEGSASGYIHVSASDTLSESVSTQSVQIPQGQSYLEFDYKGTVSFQVGMVAVGNNGSKYKEYQVGIKARDTWNKFYVGLEQFAGKTTGAALFVVVRATLDNGQQDGYVWLDNLKIVSY